MILQNYILDMINYFFVYWRDYNLFQIKKLWYCIYYCNYQKKNLAKNTNYFNFEQLHECVFKWLTNIDIITNRAMAMPFAWSKAPELPPVLIEVRVVQSLVFYIMVCRSLFVLLYFFFRPLRCLFFFDIRFLFIPLISSNFSCPFVLFSWHAYKAQENDMTFILDSSEGIT